MPSRTSPISFALSLAGWGLHGLAVFAFGLMAGFFWAYGFNVSLATAQMDGASYAVVQSSLNRHVRHAMFFGFFFGPPVLCALALAAGRDEWRRGWFGLLAFAGVLYALGIVLFTAQVNLPLNAYTESWDPRALPPDWAETRARWNAPTSGAARPARWPSPCRSRRSRCVRGLSPMQLPRAFRSRTRRAGQGALRRVGSTHSGRQGESPSRRSIRC